MLTVVLHPQHSRSLQSCCLASTLWFTKQLLSHTHSSTIWPPLEPLVPGLRPPPVDKHGSLGGMISVSLTPPPPAQTRPVPRCRCYFSLHLIVSMSSCREPNMMESDFWRVRRLFSFVPFEWDWKLGNRRGVQMSVARRDTKRDPTMASISALVEVCSVLRATKAKRA